MRCVFCDAELKQGCLFCSECGKEVQIVPDYNEFDDDYINGLIGNDSEYEEEAKKKAREAARKKKALKLKREKERKKKILIASIIAIVLVVIISVVIIVLVGVNNNRNNSVDYQIKKAQEAYANGDIDKAISYYDRALVLDDDNVAVMEALAALYVSIKDEESAIAIYKQILTYDGVNKNAINELVKLYDADKDYESILGLYEGLNDKTAFADTFKSYLTNEPDFNLSSGKYKDTISVEVLSKDNDEIYYTIDGQNPKEYGELYNGPIVFEEEGEYLLQAVCVNKLGLYSSIVSQKYTIEFEKPDMPEVSPDGGSYISETYISITVPKGCTAYYLWGSSDPSSKSTKYTKPFAVIEGNNVLSVIIINNKTGKCSEIYRGWFEYYSE